MQRPRIGFLLALALVVSMGVGYTASSLSKSQFDVAATPLRLTNFVAHVRDQSFSDTGWTFGVQDVTIAHRGDGSWAKHRAIYSPDGKGETGVFIEVLDVPARKYIWANSFIKSVMTFYLEDEELRELWAAENGCEAAEVKEQLWRPGLTSRRQILGQDAIRVEKRDETLGLRKITWVAPQLDCLVLEKAADFSSGAHNNRSYVSLHVGPPPQSLFEIPPDYLEHSPIAYEAAYRARFPGYRVWNDPRFVRAKQAEYLRGQEKHLRER
jgi:hypothetical protein